MDYILGPTEVRKSNPCPLGLPEKLTVAHMGVISLILVLCCILGALGQQVHALFENHPPRSYWDHACNLYRDSSTAVEARKLEFRIQPFSSSFPTAPGTALLCNAPASTVHAYLAFVSLSGFQLQLRISLPAL